MLRRLLIVAGIASLLAARAVAQEADYGIGVPVTASFGAMDSQRLRLFNPAASPLGANFRLMFYPTLRLGPHWFAYAAIQVRRMPYFYYDAFLTQQGMQADVIQGYVGYSLHRGPATMVFKAGQLTSAFGSFPLRYDDAENPVLDQPLSYITRIPVRAEQLLCGTSDLLRQHYGSVNASCGGTAGPGPGLTPATPYGLPGMQAEISASRFDARVQTTSSSPAYLDGWHISRQYLQWAAGGGFTIRQGFRIGASAFRGPYLDDSVSPWLPAGTTVRSFPATGTGVDVQWARGRLSATGEWQHFRFDAPNFVVSPQISSGYAELKVRLTPRLFTAGRVGYLATGSVLDTQGVFASSFAPTLRATELAAGCWLRPRVLLKVSYEFMQSAGQTGSRYNILGLQLVASFKPVEWAWR